MFRALAYTGFFLNLFNLAPIGFLDGGRIVTALSPWLWLVGFAIMTWLTVARPNFILILILILSVPRLFFLFRRKSDEERRYFEVTPAQRWTMAFLYFGLIALLVIGMHLTISTRNIASAVTIQCPPVSELRRFGSIEKCALRQLAFTIGYFPFCSSGIHRVRSGGGVLPNRRPSGTPSRDSIAALQAFLDPPLFEPGGEIPCRKSITGADGINQLAEMHGRHETLLRPVQPVCPLFPRLDHHVCRAAVAQRPCDKVGLGLARQQLPLGNACEDTIDLGKQLGQSFTRVLL